MRDTLKLHYAKLANMGDLLSPMIIEHCFGYKVERSSFLTAQMCAVGSCLAQYKLHGTPLMKAQQAINGFTHPTVRVWGTGFINYSDCEGRFFKRDMRFYAVRGEMTRKNVELMTGRRLDIPTGDAGILASELLDELPEKRYDVGIIPHICDLNEELVSIAADKYENSTVINVKDEPLDVIKRLAQCRTVISSSLHGLIVADSLGIPNVHVLFSDRPLGDGYKFDDYYSAYGAEHVQRDLRTEPMPEINEICYLWSITPEAADEKKKLMLESFPFPKCARRHYEKQ